MAANKAGFPVALYLDSKADSFIEEFSTSNFVAVGKSGAYFQSKSDVILGSETNKSLMKLAEKSAGLDIQYRPIHIDVALPNYFTEVAACGTAIVVLPVNKICYRNSLTLYPRDQTKSALFTLTCESFKTAKLKTNLNECGPLLPYNILENQHVQSKSM